MMLASTPASTWATAWPRRCRRRADTAEAGCGWPAFTSQGSTTAVRRAAQHGAQHPAGGAFRVAHLPPALEFLDHLDRQTRTPEDPGRWIVGAGSLAQVDPVGFQTDEARHRQAAGAGACGSGAGWAARPVAAPGQRPAPAHLRPRPAGPCRPQRPAAGSLMPAQTMICATRSSPIRMPAAQCPRRADRPALHSGHLVCHRAAIC